MVTVAAEAHLEAVVAQEAVVLVEVESLASEVVRRS